MDEFETFGEAIRAYLQKARWVTDKRTGKRLKPAQKLLLESAQPATITRKLNGEEPLYEPDIREMTSKVIWWGLVTRRSQLQRLFTLASYTLPDDEWQDEPWNIPTDDTQSLRVGKRRQNLAVTRQGSDVDVLPVQEASVEGGEAESVKEEAPTEHADTTASQETERRRYGLKFVLELIAIATKESTVVQFILLWFIVVAIIMAIIGIVWLAQHH